MESLSDYEPPATNHQQMDTSSTAEDAQVHPTGDRDVVHPGMAQDTVLPNFCIVHIFPEGSGKLVPISEEKWQLIQRCAEARKNTKNFSTSKYKPIVDSLPQVLLPSHCYHSQCYKSFSAISSQLVTQPVSSKPGPSMVKRSEISFPKSNSNTGILPPACIFCDKKWKTLPDGRKEGLGSCQTLEAEAKIREAASILKDINLLTKISGLSSLISKEAQYHHSCRNEKLKAAERLKAIRDEKPKVSSLKNTASMEIMDYVETNVLVGSRPEYLKSIYERYVSICDDLELEQQYNSVSYLGEVLKKRFNERIQLSSPESKRKGVIVHSSLLDYKSISVVYDYKTSAEGQVTTAALLLRKALKSVPKGEIKEPLNIENFLEGEGEAPDIVLTFFRTLYGGPRLHKHSEAIVRRAAAASADALFIVQHGRLIPKKHILLSTLMKSLTGSRKILTVLNKFGYTVSYTKEEELETELASSILSRGKECPDGVKVGATMGTAFDNYDELTHTLSGANTLHDTMGILYQIKSDGPSVTVQSKTQGKTPATAGRSTSSKSRQKRKLELPQKVLQPYRKKPKMNTFAYTVTEIPKTASLTRGKQLDKLWMMGHAFSAERLPMWAGFNARFYKDHIKKQDVYYLPNLEQPPTENEVVIETMKISQRCAEECEQHYAIVTYDLDVAKRAVKIQNTESPTFDNLFVMYGIFHIMICLFRCIGKFVEESGGPDLLSESECLAPGSTKGFLKCTTFKRCKRVHSLLALAMETLHYCKFLDGYPEKDEVLSEMVKFDIVHSEEVDLILNSKVFQNLHKAYCAYTEETLAGAQGKTPQYWMTYVKMVHLYYQLDRATRENDVSMFIEVLSECTGVFFALNRPNYARYMSKYCLDLLNLETTHPGLRQLMDSGAFSVRRTDNSFARLPIDLTLEQTVNRDAASRTTGYVHSTNNYSGRVRWSVTKGCRAFITKEAMKMAGMKEVGDDIQAELRPSRIKRDNKDLKRLLKQIEDSVNPFELEVDAPLVNISTGKAVPDEVAHSLTSIFTVGAGMHSKFIAECIADPSRFEKSIQRNNLLTFVKQCIGNRRASPNSKEAILRCTSELFGRIAFLAATNEVNMEFLFTFPLTPVPLSLCKGDGTMAHTNKSVLMECLESTVTEHGEPSQVKAHVIDGNFLLHCLPPKIPPTFGGLSKAILQSALTHKSSRIDIVFDTYESPSIKDCERERRGTEHQQFVIVGPEQVRPRKLEKALKSTSFKQALPRFLLEDWCNDEYATIIGDREVYLGVDDVCARFTVLNGVIWREFVDELSCNHPEADTRVCFHAYEMDHQPGDVVVRASDTDILVILLYQTAKFTSDLWMEVGTTGKDNRRYLSITKIADAVGPGICEALPAFHALTGCDYTSAFVRKGKKTPLGVMRSDDEIQAALSELAANRPQADTVKVVERFVSRVYGAKKNPDINSHRYEIVKRTYGKTKENGKPFDKLKSIDASAVPPCSRELFQHINRASFVARMWATAHTAILEKVPSVEDGWEVEESRYRIIWFQGDQLPEVLVPKLNVPKLNGDETEAVEVDEETEEDPDMDEQDESEQSDSEFEADDDD